MTGPRVVRSEWAKLWSLRSTWVALALAVFCIVVPGLLSADEYRAANGKWDITAVDLSLLGVEFTHLVMGALGVLVMAGEYSTGLIRSTLAAVPRRLPVLFSKAAVYGVVAWVVGAVAAVGTFLGIGPILSGTEAAQSITEDGVIRTLLGVGLYLGLVGVIGVALGALLRSVAAGITVMFALLFLVPVLVNALAYVQPGSVWWDIYPYLPSVAGDAMHTAPQDADEPGLLTPTEGLLTLLGWCAAALAGASLRLKLSDA
ncbi:MAG: ABC transporter permease [Micromonosporaceae bacterium]